MAGGASWALSAALLSGCAPSHGRVARAAPLQSAQRAACEGALCAAAPWAVSYGATARGRAQPWQLPALSSELEARTRPWLEARRPTPRDRSLDAAFDSVFALGIGDPAMMRFVRTREADGPPRWGWVPRGALAPTWWVDVHGDHAALAVEVEPADLGAYTSATRDRSACLLRAPGSCHWMALLEQVLIRRARGGASAAWASEVTSDQLISTVIDARVRALCASIQWNARAARDLDAVRDARSLGALLAVVSPGEPSARGGVSMASLDVALAWATLAVERAMHPVERRAARPGESLSERVDRVLTELSECSDAYGVPGSRCAVEAELVELAPALERRLSATEPNAVAAQRCRIVDGQTGKPMLVATFVRAVVDEARTRASAPRPRPSGAPSLATRASPPARIRIARPRRALSGLELLAPVPFDALDDEDPRGEQRAP